MFIEQPPQFIRRLYSRACWRMDSTEKAVYLTFDDGPIPEVTPWVLDVLDKYGIKATFFMVGDNARRYPDLLQEVVRRGHGVGNHTMNHLQGRKVTTEDYLANTAVANEMLKTNLFRPPHGLMRFSQSKALKKDYLVVMYDVVTRDYARNTDGEEVLENVKRYTRNGSIIVFHDSLKSIDKLRYALPRAIEWLLANGYNIEKIPVQP